MRRKHTMEERLYTIDDWAEIEAAQPDLRFEFADGRLVAMAGGTFRHAQVKASVADALRSRLRSRCTVTESDLRVQTARGRIYRLPDVVVLCSPPELVEIPGVGEALTNPTLLVEVLSETTSRSDLEEKLIEYMALETLEEYWVVDPERVRILQYLRGGRYVAYTAEEGRLHSEALGLEIPLAEIYAG